MAAGAVKRLDWTAKVATLLCFGSSAVMYGVLGFPEISGWADIPLLLGGLLVGVLMLGAPQLAMLAAIRGTSSKRMRLSFLAASAMMIGAFYFFLVSADLKGSTAPLSLFFFSLYLAIAAGVLAALALWLRSLVIHDR